MRGQIDEVADGVHLVAGTHTNAFVVRDGDETLLVDALFPADAPLLAAALRDLGQSLADVTALVITHGHVDHIGAAHRLQAGHGVAVHAHRAEAAQVRGEVEERIATAQILLRLWWPPMARFAARVLRAGALRVKHPQTVETFEDGTPLDLPGRPVPVFTPGHTSGHCAFHLPERGVLLTGDALVNEDVLTGERGPRLLDPLFNHDQSETEASLDRLAEVEAEVVGPGHGGLLRMTPREAVQAAKARLDG